MIIRNSCEWFPLLFHYLVSTNIQPCMFVQLRDTCYAKFLYSFVAVQAKYELSLKSEILCTIVNLPCIYCGVNKMLKSCGILSEVFENLTRICLIPLWFRGTKVVYLLCCLYCRG